MFTGLAFYCFGTATARVDIVVYSAEAIPKASEIEEKGVNLGELQMKLLEKIEELTLYTVQQKQEIDRQKEEAAAEVTVLKERINALEELAKRLLQTDKAGQ
ncbi:MAG: hypothetical protein EHM61_07685 [Acidobacteria bacterium]|nr:MAG: hypothetical protein EHM61_07685 [Acidobacteriota bacterium]